ncbi:MAG: hypothetical protein V1875_01970 [Candidatus Altiarchaeota archaeon]
MKEVTAMEDAYVNMVGGMVRAEVEESVAAQVGQMAGAFCLLIVAALLRELA